MFASMSSINFIAGANQSQASKFKSNAKGSGEVNGKYGWLTRKSSLF